MTEWLELGEKIPQDMRDFLNTDDSDVGVASAVVDGLDLAYQELYVREQLLGQPNSRFVHEGGVHFNSVQSYVVTAANLAAMAVNRRGLGDVQLELLKFRFMIDPLPPSRSYSAVRVRITLRPAARVLMIAPNLVTTDTDVERTTGSEVALEIARLLQLHLAQTNGETIKRTEKFPVTTAVNHDTEGFGWDFLARDGAPLFPREVVTTVLVELPRGTASLCGLFDSEALINRHVLGTPHGRRATPVNAAVPFSVDLTALPQT